MFWHVSSVYGTCSYVLQCIMNVWRMFFNILSMYGSWSCTSYLCTAHILAIAYILQFIFNVWRIFFNILSMYGTWSCTSYLCTAHILAIAYILQFIINVWRMFFNVLSMYGEYSSISHLMYVWQLILQIFCTYGQCPCYGVASVSRID